MRNLKKILALALALVMTLSLMTIANAFTDDSAIDAKYNVAVQVLADLEVFQGREEDGSFDPKDNITRAEVAAIIYRIVTKDVDDSQIGLYANWNKFDDVTAEKWFAGYVNYCANATYIKGRSATVFDPDDNVTGYEALAMILRAVGYDQKNEWTGAGWEIKVASTAKDLGVTDGITGVDLSSPVSREVVAQLLFNAIQESTVTYFEGIVSYRPTGPSLGVKNFNLAGPFNGTDEWGRPYTYYTHVNGTTSFDVAYVTTHTVAVSECDIATDLGKSGNFTLGVYDNGVLTENVSFRATDTVKDLGAQGTLIEVYTDRLVIIDTYLARVDATHEATTDAAGHPATAAYSDVTVWYNSSVGTTQWDISGTAYAAGTYILVNYNEATKKVVPVQAAESFVGAQTRNWYNASQHTIDNNLYDDAVHFLKDDAGTQLTMNFVWFKDQYGNLIGSATINRTSYAVLKDIVWVIGTPGYAQATLVNMDGTEYTAIVDEFDGITTTGTTAGSWDTNNHDRAPVLSDSNMTYPNVSTDTRYNTLYLGYALYNVTTKDNGHVDLDSAQPNSAAVLFDQAADIDVASSQILVNDTNDRIYIDDSTVFLVRTGSVAAGYTYTSYNRNTVIDFADNAVIYYTVGANGIADRVYVKSGVEEAELGNHLYVLTDNYYQISGTDDFYMTVNVDGVERTIATTEAVAEYLAANVGKVFHLTWGTNPYTGLYGFVTAAYLVNESVDVADNSCNYLTGTVLFGNNTIVSAEGSYTINSDTVFVGATSVSQADLATKGVWIEYYNNGKFDVAAVVYVGTKLSDVVSTDLVADDGTAEYDAATVTWTITLPYDDDDTDITITSDAVKTKTNDARGNTLIEVDGTNFDGIYEGTVTLTSIDVGDDFTFTVYAEDGVNTAGVTYKVEIVNSHYDVKENVINLVWDEDLIITCSEADDGYKSVSAATVVSLDVSKASNLSFVLEKPDKWTAEYGIFTSTAEAEKATDSQFDTISSAVPTSSLKDGNILVIKVTKTDGGTLELADGCTVPAVYVVYRITNVG